MRITASLVLYKTPDDMIRRVLDCVERSVIDTVFVFDNSSQERIASVVAGYQKAQFAMHDNTGYGSTHNDGFRMAMLQRADYHIVLNPDIAFEPESIEVLAAYMEQHPEVGQVMPRVVYPDGSLQYLCKLLPTPMDLLLRRFTPEFVRKKNDARFKMLFTHYDTEMQVPFLSGCFMFLRMADVARIKGFDERFFMYGEDIDFSRRMHGVAQTMYYPAATVVHDHAAASYHNRRMLRIHIRNVMRYFNKWGWFFDGERRRINRRILEQWQN
ncbi:MAG: glycosyltransferase family 2 protein [Paludibacteraceae bacterium]|nr:glycosyltransferase family 2 protein [Paludibacteraceae bacterium]